jgi:hypothetical protein
MMRSGADGLAISMIKRTSWRRALVGVAGGLALVPAAAGAVGTLDQQQPTNGGSSVSLVTDRVLAQTFTAGLNGSLDTVELSMFRFGSPAEPVTVEIRNVNPDGSPGTTLLASSSIAASSPPQYPEYAAFVPASFSSPAVLSADTKYAIVAHSSTPFIAADNHDWAFAGGNTYTLGSGYDALHPDGPWTLDNLDFAFKTYVTSPPPQCGGLNATVPGTPGNDVLTGTDGVDVIAGLGGNDKITSKTGDDVICGGDGNDTIDAGGGNDKVDAGNGTTNTIEGGSGNDTLTGGTGADTLNGGSNDDTLDGAGGADKLSGGSDKDKLTGNTGSPDSCDGGSGTDSGGTGCETTKSIP